VSELNGERCPALEDLLQAEDSALSPEAQARVLTHLRHCVSCRTRVFAKAATRDASVPKHLARLYSEEAQRGRRARFTEQLHERKQARIHRAAGWALRRWLPMAAITPVVILGFLLSQTHEVVVQADELLQRAATIEQTRAVSSGQRVRMRWMPPNATPIPALGFASFTATQELRDGIAVAGPFAAPPSGTPASLARMLAQHQFTWGQPFSVARFKAWRGTLVHRRDQVMALTAPTGVPALVLKTATTDDGELREVELMVERDSYRVIRETFVFEEGRLEIEELAQWVRQPEPARAAAAGMVATAMATPPPDRDALQRSELEARWALGETGLDLRGTIRVSSTRELVRIYGSLASATERETITARLTALPHVSVNVRLGSDAGATAGTGSAIEYGSRATPPASGLAGWLDRTLVDETERAVFVPELTRLVTSVRQHLVVLHDLAERYPESEMRGLSSEARGTFERLVDLHYRGVRRDLRALDVKVRVLGGSVSREIPASQVPVDWSRRTAAGLTQAIALDGLVQELLAHQDLPPTAQRHGQDSINTTFSALWDAVNARHAHGSRSGS
jgi:hypothetical protein